MTRDKVNKNQRATALFKEINILWAVETMAVVRASRERRTL